MLLGAFLAGLFLVWFVSACDKEKNVQANLALILFIVTGAWAGGAYLIAQNVFYWWQDSDLIVYGVGLAFPLGALVGLLLLALLLTLLEWVCSLPGRFIRWVAKQWRGGTGQATQPEQAETGQAPEGEVKP